jgi:DNA-binding transcriptional LysR family regulator
VPAEVRREKVLEDDLCVVTRRSRRSAGVLTLEQYRDARHIVVSARATGAVLEDHALAQFGIERRVSIRCRSYGTALRLAETSDDLLTIPMRLAMGLGGDMALVRLRLPVKTRLVRVYAYWHANSDRDPSNLWLRNLLRQAAKKHSAHLTQLAR